LYKASDDYVDECRLPDLVQVQTRAFVRFEHLRTDAMEQVNFFIRDRHKVQSFGLQRIECTSVQHLESQIDEVTELFCLIRVSKTVDLHF
jgi:hypothetical protein